MLGPTDKFLGPKKLEILPKKAIITGTGAPYPLKARVKLKTTMSMSVNSLVAFPCATMENITYMKREYPNNHCSETMDKAFYTECPRCVVHSYT